MAEFEVTFSGRHRIDVDTEALESAAEYALDLEISGVSDILSVTIEDSSVEIEVSYEGTTTVEVDVLNVDNVEEAVYEAARNELTGLYPHFDNVEEVTR
jgi:Iap family predicted aminopeptidase